MSRDAYDIVAIGDFRFPGGASSGPAEQIRIQAQAGYRTALIQVKGPVLKYPHPLNPNIRKCLDEGLADLIDPSQAVSAPLALAFHPQIFTYRSDRPLRVNADVKLLVASHPLVDGAGEPYYDWETINSHVQEALGQDVKWAPLGPLVRAPVAGLDNSPPLHDKDWLEIVDVAEWEADRHEFNGARPVIGRHSRPDPLKWPDDRDTILAAYPDDPACVVRILGGGGFLSDLVGPYPDNWEVLPFNRENPKEFLKTIDFFVYYHHSRWVEAFGRVFIEAMASGALAILPPHFKPVLGDGAAYGGPEDVKDLVAHFYSDRQAYLRQTQAAREVLEERFSPPPTWRD